MQNKLTILSDAAKHDASCASCGGKKRDRPKGGIRSSVGSGICHADTPDGRCLSLLKILMTNFSIFDCNCGINRAPLIPGVGGVDKGCITARFCCGGIRRAFCV
jgi:predicted DNA-binding helix-hairpin-helix protein